MKFSQDLRTHIAPMRSDDFGGGVPLCLDFKNARALCADAVMRANNMARSKQISNKQRSA
jgi:hypothetical protein